MKHDEGASFPDMPLIRRVHPTSDETPPWVGIFFVPSVGSDELAEQLKARYPQCQTLRERKHMAAIEFLKLELDRIQSERLAANSTTQSILECAPSASPMTSVCYDETVEGHSCPESVHMSDSPARSRKLSSGAELDARQTKSRSAKAQRLPTDTAATAHGQQFVFNAADGRTMEPKTKRKMTVQEKGEYKRTRKRGACPKCRRHKEKCTHTIDHAVQLDGLEKPAKATKRRSSMCPTTDEVIFNKSHRSEHASDVRHLASDLPKQLQLQVSGQPAFHHTSSEVPTRGDIVLVDAQREVDLRSRDGSERSGTPSSVNSQETADSYLPVAQIPAVMSAAKRGRDG
ncbi:hypothetical protein P153DRAFT_367787 [Dothidotthia symphoricarpi CBS 119687]|uniref:Uncharacterized protein n=1 Tax=Dothidotthia symphoricarpi CBS 119687 TaxID=1392245 RepID=A0A6A6AD79_9PLEO|nr:uncharacterized protein P153DRAFT_367787 [Dothidotthia symphoricarpi CBS 119687]KAF2128701.1 hypothetical protein P153DRAFT_367787 [Dothidotthia symphoricarpi CBS 119687]